MPMAEGEALVRASMKVGRVLEGQRAFAPGAKLGAIQPLTSGKLFIREDGREVVALFDEPPAASGTVLAVWRRLYVDPGMATSDGVLKALESKYGPLSPGQALRPNARLFWFASDPACRQGWGNESRRELMTEWHDDGKGDPHLPTEGFMQGVTGASWGPRWPLSILNFEEPRGRFPATCGPTLAATVLDATTLRQPSHYVEVILFDPTRYGEAFKSSRKLLRAASEGSVPKIKF